MLRDESNALAGYSCIQMWVCCTLFWKQLRRN